MTTIPVPRETGRLGMTQRESGVLRACLDLLAAERIWHRRWNTGAVKDGKRFFRFGRKGDADILAIMRSETLFAVDDCEITHQPVWIETKATRGKQTKEQREFQREVEAEGHIYLLIRDAAELQAWLKRTQGMKQSGEHVKPEAAAPEPQCNHDPYDLCEVCSPEMSVPATPAPSQPAGEREPDEEWPRSVEGVVQALAYLHGRATESGAGASMNLLPIPTAIYWLRELAQQTAAKDAAYERLAEATVADLKALKAEKEAAERERDSLREFVESLIHNNKCDCLMCIRIRKALKAGKDGQL